MRPGAASLLLAPLGAHRVIDDLRVHLRAAGVHHVVVAPGFASDEQYADALQTAAPGVELMPVDGLGSLLDGHELADRLLLVDARYMPRAGWSFARLLGGRANGHHVCHIVAAGTRAGGLQESVQYDAGLRVLSVQRLYDGITNLALAHVSCSLVPVAAARRLGPSDLASLSRVRARLTEAGMPSFDEGCPGGIVDLAAEEGLLAANTQAVFATAGRRNGHGFTELGAGIWVGRDVTLHPASRLYGPIVVHDGVRVSSGAVLMGPLVVGAEARIGQDATVAQSVVWPRARVAPGVGVVRCVLTASHDEARSGNGHGGHWQSVADTPVSVTDDRRASRLFRFVKRAMDLLIAVPGLIVISPLLILVALLVKLTSRGPVLFGHDREGRGGRPFRCWKFRTMVADAHAQQRALYKQNAVDGPQFKLTSDPRITRIGHWLRRTNIDELPQLLNVVLGQMSLIGPRPSPFRENQICVSWRQARLSVRPGITGLWQVCRRDRDAGDFHQWIYYDVLYVRHQSLWLDLRIALATLATLAGRWPVKLHWMIPAARLAASESLLEAGAAWAEGPRAGRNHDGKGLETGDRPARRPAPAETEDVSVAVAHRSRPPQEGVS